MDQNQQHEAGELVAESLVEEITTLGAQSYLNRIGQYIYTAHHLYASIIAK